MDILSGTAVSYTHLDVYKRQELSARIMAVVRRRSFKGNDVVTFNELTIDIQSKVVKVKDQTLTLTRKEFDLLVYFVANKAKVISKSAAVTHISVSYTHLDVYKRQNWHSDSGRYSLPHQWIFA